MKHDVPTVLHTRVVTGTGGGPEKTILNSSRFLTVDGYRVLCAYMHPPGDPGFEELRGKAAALGASLEGIEDRGPWDWRVVARLLALCRREQVTIWHAHDYKSNAVGLMLRRFWPMRLVTTVHGWVNLTLRAPIYHWLDRRCLRHYERVICVSTDLYEQCLSAKVPAGRCLVIENAIDTSQFSRRTPVADSKRRLGFDPERLLIGTVGRLSKEKGFEGLVRAADSLLEQGLNVELVIVGEGDSRPSLERLIASLRRQDRIRLLGYRSDVTALYEAMDVFALNSLREGLPNVLLEAMAMGAPAVASRVGGIPRLIEDGTSGLLHESGDLAGLCRNLQRVLSQPDLRVQLAARGRRTVEQSYSFAARMAKVRAVYDELLESTAPGAAAPPPWKTPDTAGGASSLAQADVQIKTWSGAALDAHHPRWTAYVERQTVESLSRHPGWLPVLRRGLKQEPYCVEALAGGRIVGLLPLALVRSLLFGRFLVGLPYLSTGGVLADNEDVAKGLIDRAVALANSLDVRYLELRHEQTIAHPALAHTLTSKVQMRLSLPHTSDGLWKEFDPKVRNQVRKGEKVGLSVHWGGDSLLGDFYAVFSRNMRDLGTPVFSRRLFESILLQFPDRAELCVVRCGAAPVAAGLLVHGRSVSEVLSASSLRSHNATCANMLMYWHLLQRAIGRGQRVFDFGRSTPGDGTFRFKSQWGAEPHPLAWQYYVRRGNLADMRREHGKYARLVAAWQRLPVALTRIIGPVIVRGIP